MKMKMYPGSGQRVKGLITKAQAGKIAKRMRKEMPDLGITVHLSKGVTMVKIKNPVKGPIKHRFALCGTKNKIDRFVGMVLA